MPGRNGIFYPRQCSAPANHTLQRWSYMSLVAKIRQFSATRLPLVLGVYIVLQPLIDILTAIGAMAEMDATVGAVVRAAFMVLCFLYVVFISHFKGKKWCILVLGIICAYLLVFLLWMYSLGGLSLCLENIKELAKVYLPPSLRCSSTQSTASTGTWSPPAP